MRVEQALALLPEVEDLAPLRDALIAASGHDAERSWTGSGPYATLGTRLASADALEAEVPALVARARDRMEAVYREVAALGGSISAEHGLGQLKRVEITRHKDPLEMELMRAVKQALDPRGLMNPGKVL